jgi:Mg2+-importing ATPase
MIVGVGIWLPYSPFAGALGFVALPMLYWPLVGLMLVCYVTLAQLVKTWFVRRYGYIPRVSVASATRRTASR